MHQVRGVLARGRWLLAAVLLACCALGAFAPAASADGDPASDVLVYQNLFVTAESGMSTGQQAQVASLLSSAAHAGFPIRVAIIGAPVDLGAVTALWDKPAAYANFLGVELSLVYNQRLLIVMPNGFGFDWTGHPAGPAYGVLNQVDIGAGGDGLTTATITAVQTLAAASGIKLATPAAPAAPSHGISRRKFAEIALIVIASLAICDGIYRLTKRFGPRLARGWRPWLAALPRRLRRPVVGTSVAGVVVLAVVAGIVIPMETGPPAGGASIPQSTLLAENPGLDPGQSLSGAAPGFTLTGQSGQPVSLGSYRGKVVILAFVDPGSTTLGPMTTAALLDAKAMLGTAGSQVQLLGVDTSATATSVADVRSYSQFHGMASQWSFLTGSPSQLHSVWQAYSVHGVTVGQSPAVFVIAPDGRLAKLYLTRQSYAAVSQFGQLLAGTAAGLLPGHPAVRSHLSYATVPGTSPAATTTVPRAKGGNVTIGPGDPAQPRLYLFFATWDQQSSDLATQLKALNSYQLAAGAAGLPSLTAMDEGSVEPSSSPLPSLLTSLKAPLWYELAVDRTGQAADGYRVRGAPWLVLVSPSGKLLWSWDVSTSGWLTTAALDQHVRAALAQAK